MKNLKISLLSLVAIILLTACDNAGILNSAVIAADVADQLLVEVEATYTTSTFDEKEPAYISSIPSMEIFEKKELQQNRNNLTVHFLDVGKADSIFIELPNLQTMLIDASENSQANKIITYIHQQGYDSIDFVIVTHPHDDHIGGMDNVINNFNVANIYMSPAPHTTLSYENLLRAIENSGADVYTPFAGEVILHTDDLLVEVVAPKDENYSNLNNASIVIKLTYDENIFLFTGDAEKEAEDSIWTNIKCDVLKVGHHGSNTSTTSNFLKKTEPNYAVISAGLGNSYGHPTDKVLQRLHERNIQIFRTDLQGTIVATSDGKEIDFNIKPYQYENITASATTNENKITENAEHETEYTLNTNSKKIHYSYCHSVQKMSEKNKSFTDDFDSAIADEYSPCGIFTPE